ncbi:ROK family transcriptional regulator [Actinoplanes sp. GCM10030250]|uniref:ROK family transcriptional regulator n=1 Tax=Actinoplanes sp. GCM10030250 TaxID=3273376 RepID=UPI0036164553
MDAVKPSSELVRAVTDENVLRALMRHSRLTRAELAGTVDISKPTAGESVRRLAERGLVIDTGERTPGGRGRGRVGSYYSLAPGVGTALAIDIAPGGVVAECVDAYGDTVTRAAEGINRPAEPAQVAAALRAAVTAIHDHIGQIPRLAVVSAADPVDRATGRLLQLPDAPFLVGELDPAEILRPYVTGPITVDNDVNWAARAERDESGDPALADFAYLFLGEGLGCAVSSDGEIRRGHTGLAGEIAHLVTTGPDGSAVRLIEVFEQLGLRRPDSTAIDVEKLLAGAPPVRGAVARAVSGALSAIVALADPREVIVGGPWGSHPDMIDALRSAFAEAPRSTPIRAATLTEQPSLIGARRAAITGLRTAIIAMHGPRAG